MTHTLYVSYFNGKPYVTLGNAEAVIEELEGKLEALSRRPADDEVTRLREALGYAFDFLGGVDDAVDIRGHILAALATPNARSE